MEQTLEKRRIGYILIAIAAVTYSTTEIAIGSLNGVFAPMQLTVERVLGGALALLPFTVLGLRKSKVHLTRGDAVYFALLGFLTVALHMTFLQLAIMNASASAVAAIYSGNAIFAAVAAYFILREPLRRRNIAALALELIGILILVDPFHPQMSMTGFVHTMLATVLFGIYGVLSKLRVAKFGSIATSCFALIFGGVELLTVLLLGKLAPVAAFYERIGLSIYADVPFFTGFTLRSTLIFAYICIVVTGLGFLLMTRAVEYTSATEASFIYFAKPVIATVFAAVLLGDKVTAHHAAGLCFFAAASLVVLIPTLRELREQRSQTKSEEEQSSS